MLPNSFSRRKWLTWPGCARTFLLHWFAPFASLWFSQRSRRLFILVFGLITLWEATPRLLLGYINYRGANLPDFQLHADRLDINIWNGTFHFHGVSIVKRSGVVPVPLVLSPGVRAVFLWSELIHGRVRLGITALNPQLNFVQGPTQAQSQYIPTPAWIKQVKGLVRLRIDRLVVQNGDIHFYDFQASPLINLQMDQTDFVADNLDDGSTANTPLPSSVMIKGRPLRTGTLDFKLWTDLRQKEPTFKERVQVDQLPLPALNPYLAKHVRFVVKSGVFSFYNELVSHKGSYQGYVKPFFNDLEFAALPQHDDALSALWTSLANGAKDLLVNHRNVAATQIPISGHYTDPHIGLFNAVFGLLVNAYWKSLAQGFDQPELLVKTSQKPL